MLNAILLVGLGCLILYWVGLYFHDRQEAKKPIPTRMVEVGKAIATITTADKEYKIEFVGNYNGIEYFFPHEDDITTAHDRFLGWRKYSGQTGMVSVGNNEYIPLCNVKNVVVAYENHQVEVKGDYQ